MKLVRCFKKREHPSACPCCAIVGQHDSRLVGGVTWALNKKLLSRTQCGTPELRPGGGMPKTEAILPGTGISQDFRDRQIYCQMALGRIGQTRRSDRTRPAATAKDGSRKTEGGSN